MSNVDYDLAIAEYLRKRSVTRCPTVCAAPTQARIGEADRAAYRDHVAAREAARAERLRQLQQFPG
ncbi:MAG TPA: hypothetical protein VM755_16090 [Stellaceae bacterium]|nr:hypothetical protein [Stellaceae bacterium]